MTGMGPDHDRFADSIGAFVLQALPEREEIEFEAHMASCAACRDEVDDLRAATHALALSVPAMAPPPNLKARVMQVVEQEAELLRAAGPEADRPQRAAATRASEPRERRRRFSNWALRPAFALPAALFVLALGTLIGLASGGAFDDSGAGTRSVRAEVDPDKAPNARVYLEMKDGNATLVGERMPAPPEGRVYQVWVKRPNVDPEPTSTLFMPRSDGSASASVPASMEGVEAVLVSHEPPGGSPAPTSAPILTVSPSA